MITSIIEPDDGQILLDGAPVGELAQERIGYLPEERGLYKKLTVAEQLLYFAQLKGLGQAQAKQRIGQWLEKLDAQGWENKKVQELSKGMQQKVQFISTLIHEPRLVILDEPFSGLDPVNAQLLIDTVRGLRQSETTVLLSTHQMDQVEKLCDDIALINRGQVVLNGTVRDVKQGYRSDRVIVGYDGDDHAVQNIDGTEVLSATAGRVELRITAPSLTSDALLHMLIDRVHITRFELAEPSLHDIFIKTVG
jgi:ABC-2 type transport system ATP-binding protein